MKKILIFLLLLVSISGYSQLNLPFGVKVLNPVPLDSKYYNTSGAAYTNTAQVISQLTSGLRYEGLTVNVAGTEYWFYGGVADGDLVAKAGGSMVYPSAGLAKSTGSAWGTSITAGAGVETWLTTPSWTNFNSAITGTAPFWGLTGTSTLTGNATIDGGANDLLFTNIDTLSVSTTYGDLAFEYEPIDGEPHIRMETVGKIDFSSRLFNVLSTGFYFQGGGYLDGSLQMSTMVGTGSRLSLFNASGIFTASPYSVPTSDGTSGQVLQTNGSGVVTWQTPSGGGLTVGTSTITSGSNTKILYDNSGVLGEYTVSGSGNVAMTTSPTFVTPILGTPTSGTLTNATGLPWSSGLVMTGSNTMTGSTTLVGSTSNSFTFSIPNVSTSTTTGLFALSNPTGAGAGAQQYSPVFRQTANIWKTNATAGSQTVDYDIQTWGLQGAAAPYGYWSLYNRINGGTQYENLRVRNDGVLYLLGGSSSTATLYFGTAGDLSIQRGFSGTQGLRLYGPSATANIYSLSISANNSNNYSYTSGTGGMLGLAGNFIAASGAGNFYGVNATGTINMTGTSSGNVFNYGVNQTVTAALGNYTGFYHNPTVTSITGNHLSFHATSGNVLLPASSYINIGSTVGSSGYGFRDNAGILESKDSGGDWSPISEIKTVKVTVSSAEILALNTTPKTLVAAPGAGKVVQLISCYLFLDYNTTTYLANTSISAVCNGYVLGTSATFLSNSSDGFGSITPNSANTNLDQVNQALSLKTDIGDPTTGNSPLYVYVTYRIITL